MLQKIHRYRLLFLLLFFLVKALANHAVSESDFKLALLYHILVLVYEILRIRLSEKLDSYRAVVVLIGGENFDVLEQENVDQVDELLKVFPLY